MTKGTAKVTKKSWYLMGGFSNSKLYRRNNGRCYEYYVNFN